MPRTEFCTCSGAEPSLAGPDGSVSPGLARQASGRNLRVVASKQLALLRLHFFGFFGVLVVHAHQVQKAMNDQQRHLIVVVARVLRSVAERYRRAYDDIPEQHGHIFWLREHPRTCPPGIGRATALDRLFVDRECQYVSRPVLIQEPAVQLGDGRFVHEKHGQFGVPRKPFFS